MFLIHRKASGVMGRLSEEAQEIFGVRFSPLVLQELREVDAIECQKP